MKALRIVVLLLGVAGAALLLIKGVNLLAHGLEVLEQENAAKRTEPLLVVVGALQIVGAGVTLLGLAWLARVWRGRSGRTTASEAIRERAFAATPKPQAPGH